MLLFTFVICTWLTNFQVINCGLPVECRRSSLGFDYLGHVNVTVTGRTCQAWNSQSPHTHSYTDSRQFPDNSLDDANNYCRNPAPGDAGGLWCYTTDPNTRWEACDVPACSEYPECRLTDLGSEYRGHINTAKSGASCMPWSTVDKSAAHGGMLADANYCRNPDSKPQGPWCYTGSDNSWEYCDVPFCKPSAYCKNTATGEKYSGTVSVTENGAQCQRWDSQYPHQHEFGDDPVTEAANYCRNPNGLLRPWCYTVDPNIEWEYCDIPDCIDCMISEYGVEYSGLHDQTVTSKSCLPWASLSAHAAALQDPDRFPDATLEDAQNYCRNPDRRARGPWCFHGDDPTQWEYCDIPSCTGKKDDTFKPRLANHVVHIGIDGINPCFVNSSSGAANILNRVAADGTYTLTRGRTELQTVSSPSWTAIVCSLPAETSGTTANSWRPPWLSYAQSITPVTGNDVPFPCVWQQIKGQDANVRTASFTDWDWFWYINSLGMPSALDFDYYCDDWTWCDEKLVEDAADYLNVTFRAAESSYTFVYMGNVDGVGHAKGWCQEDYMAEVDKVDRLVGILMDVIDEAELRDPHVKVTVMLSTDHGGHDYSHGSWQDSDIIIPAFVRAPRFSSAAAGNQFRHEVRNIDFVPTATEWLGLKPSPWWRGQALKDSMPKSSSRRAGKR